ncbi:MAG: hypothetical protein ACREH5_06085 [Candidatus Omnitrophota bacterium]
MTKAFKTSAAVAVLGLFFVASCLAEEQSKPSVKTGSAVSGLSGSPAVKQAVVSSLQTSTAASGGTGSLDPGLKRAFDQRGRMEAESVTGTAEPTVPGSGAANPQIQQNVRELFGKAGAVGSESPITDVADGGDLMGPVLIQSDAPVIPDEDTIPIGSPRTTASAPVVEAEEAITPAADVAAEAHTVEEPEAPTGETRMGDRKRRAAQRLLADSATTEPRTITVPEDGTSAEEAPDPGGTGFESRKRRAAQRLLAGVATTEPRTIDVPDDTASGEDESIDQGDVVVQSDAPVIPDEDTIPIGSPKFAARVPSSPNDDSIPLASPNISASTPTAKGETKGESLEDNIMTLMQKLQEDKEEEIEGKDTTKSGGESKTNESS